MHARGAWWEDGLAVWASGDGVGAGHCVHERAVMWDLFGFGMLGADCGDACVGGFAGFRKRIVA